MGKWFCSSPHCYPPPSRGREKTGLIKKSHQIRGRAIHVDFRANDNIFGPGVLPGRRGLKPAAAKNCLLKPFRDPRLSSGQQGAAALEFALVAPLFLLLWFGIMDFGLAMYAKGLITNASQEGARYGSIYQLPAPTADDIQGYVQGYLLGAGLTEPVTITVTGAGGASGTTLTVRVDYTYYFLGLPRFLAGLCDSVNLSAETVKRLE